MLNIYELNVLSTICVITRYDDTNNIAGNRPNTDPLVVNQRWHTLLL